MQTIEFFEKYSPIILTILIGTILTTFASTPIILNIEMENVFNSLLINSASNDLITTNLEPTETPPLFFWLNHIFLSTFGFKLNLLKIIPALAFSGLIITCYSFMVKNSKSITLAIITVLTIATSPFFIAASKVITLDLLYVLAYTATLFIFISNIYNVTYSHLASFIAGILSAVCISTTGIMGIIPILFSYLLVNFIRGGFFYNLAFNNLFIILAGFASFVIVWISLLAKQYGFTQSFEMILNYKALQESAVFNFDTDAIFKYTSLFIVGGFPWIAIFPYAAWQTLKDIFKEMNSANINTALPLILLINIVGLSIYFSTIESQFYILLIIYLNIAILVAIKIHSFNKFNISWFTTIIAVCSVIIMFLFLNEFLNIDITKYKFDSTIKEIILNSNTSVKNISTEIFYFIAIIYTASAATLLGYKITQKKSLIHLTCLLTVINFGILSFAIFPKLSNNNLNKFVVLEAWTSKHIGESDTVVFYKLKNPVIASKGGISLYFDDATKLNTYANKQRNRTIIIAFHKKHSNLMRQTRQSSRPTCHKNICILKR
ncbi:MAG: hypothetical protein GY793_04585 [Proteobacteria bacterium]|nr:hypothetical protein [Pseudomonadota bacterium]